MTAKSAIVSALAVLVGSIAHAAEEVWSGDRTIDALVEIRGKSLRIGPGTHVKFVGDGRLRIENGSLKATRADFSAQGTLTNAFRIAVQNGRVDRKKLAAQVFSDPAALADLNTISHRFVCEEVTRRLRTWAMAGGTLAAVDAIELIESGLGERCDPVLGVLADRKTRIARIMCRDGLNEDQAAARIDAQRDEAYFHEKCDHILYNNGDEDQFSNTCREYFTEVLKNHG